jgi:UDP-N-acetylmuramate dehydrogenase
MPCRARNLAAVNLQENVALAPLTTLQVGGPARWFCEAETAEDVRAAVAEAAARGLPLFVLGGGSNLVVADEGFPGLVLRIALRGIEERREDGKTVFEAAAGEDWDAFVARTVERGCAGLECLSGIPGTVGGTPVQNVGAYGQEVSQTILAVQALDLRDGQERELCAEACGFEYRKSLFNTSERGRYIILRVSFALQPGGEPTVQYADLRRHFARHARPPSLAEVREAVRSIRLSKAMLLVPGDDDCRSAGSFFKNPIVSEAGYQAICAAPAAGGEPVPQFPTAQGLKVPAAWLVERSGFPRGYTRGAVGISRRHALAIVNRGGATAAGVMELKSDIQRAVAGEFGVPLQPEPVFVGFDEESQASLLPS